MAPRRITSAIHGPLNQRSGREDEGKGIFEVDPQPREASAGHVDGRRRMANVSGSTQSFSISTMAPVASGR